MSDINETNEEDNNTETNCIRFDWAVKKLLRSKENFVVLEGLLTVLLGQKIKIEELLDSESNKDTEDDKFNCVDMLAKNDKGELLIIEVQNTREVTYFHRMMYGTSKIITERMKSGDDYSKVKKVYSINIVYFEIGQGKDYVYHGKTEFRSLHDPTEILQLSARQKQEFQKAMPGDIFPEYYILRVEHFDKFAIEPLDQWISFLKTSKIPKNANAPGLNEARIILSEINMSEAERKSYERHIEDLRYQRGVVSTHKEEGRAEGRAEGEQERLKLEQKIAELEKLLELKLSNK